MGGKGEWAGEKIDVSSKILVVRHCLRMNNYKELKVWQKSIDLAVNTYELTKLFPQSETYGMTSQIRRSANSIAANIAEGAARKTEKEFSYFLSIALGSAFELETHLIIASKISLVSKEKLNDIFNSITEIEKMIRGLQKINK
jgi:four helix bundle protein